MEIIGKPLWVEGMGWIAAFLTIAGFWRLSKKEFVTAQILFIISNVLYAFYDSIIYNWSHIFLLTMITVFNIIGLVNHYSARSNAKRMMAQSFNKVNRRQDGDEGT